MNSKDFLKEGFVEDASDVHMDHEVQMAREECYHAAEHALAIHKLLRNISEQQGLEGWVSSKITLANDYLNTVREHLEYELLQPQIDDVAIGMPIAENEQQGVAEGLGLYGPFTVTISTGERPQSRTKTKKFRREDDAILWAQDWLEDFPQYSFATAEVTDPEGNVVWTTDEQGVAEGAKCNHTMEGENCPVHGLKECPSMKARALAEWRKAERAKRQTDTVNETTAGSVAGVVNAPIKNKAKVGSLFGGSYKQPKKAKKV